MCPRISRWFLLVICFLYLFLFLGGASLGILSGSSLISPFSSLFSPFLPSSFLSLGLSLSLRAWLVSSVGFSLSFIPIFSLLGPAWAYCPARHSSLSSSYYLFLLRFSLLSALPHLLPFSQGVCPKRLRPTWQHLMTQSGL